MDNNEIARKVVEAFAEVKAKALGSRDNWFTEHCDGFMSVVESADATPGDYGTVLVKYTPGTPRDLYGPTAAGMLEGAANAVDPDRKLMPNRSVTAAGTGRYILSWD